MDNQSSSALSKLASVLSIIVDTWYGDIVSMSSKVKPLYASMLIILLRVMVLLHPFKTGLTDRSHSLNDFVRLAFCVETSNFCTAHIISMSISPLTTACLMFSGIHGSWMGRGQGAFGNASGGNAAGDRGRDLKW